MYIVRVSIIYSFLFSAAISLLSEFAFIGHRSSLTSPTLTLQFSISHINARTHRTVTVNATCCEEGKRKRANVLYKSIWEQRRRYFSLLCHIFPTRRRRLSKYLFPPNTPLSGRKQNTPFDTRRPTSNAQLLCGSALSSLRHHSLRESNRCREILPLFLYTYRIRSKKLKKDLFSSSLSFSIVCVLLLLREY